MKPEERLFDLIGALPDDLTCQTDIPQKKRRRISPKNQNRWIGIGVAACLVAAFVGWGMNSKPYYARDDANLDHPAIGLPGQKDDIVSSTPAIGLPGPKLEWPIINGAASESALAFTMLPVNEHVAEYHQVENPRGIPKAQRPQYLGEAYLNLDDWYLPFDNTGLRYLVRAENDGSYTLWEFSHFVVWDQETLDEVAYNIENDVDNLWSGIEWFNLNMDFSPYSYGEVLETIYGVTSADDLSSVTVEPSKADNTDAGKKLQKEIGTQTVWKRESLDALYEALVNMTCYGADNWDMIDLGSSDGEGGMLYSVALSRYLTIELADGSTIDTLKYTANSGSFYEFSGIAYSPLDAETAAQMNEIFKIET